MARELIKKERKQFPTCLKLVKHDFRIILNHLQKNVGQQIEKSDLEGEGVNQDLMRAKQAGPLQELKQRARSAL